MVTVMSANRGGLVVQYSTLEGFIPVSHLGQVRARVLGCVCVVGVVGVGASVRLQLLTVGHKQDRAKR